METRVEAKLPPENIFGHTKKLEYIRHHLKGIVQKNPAARILDFGYWNGSAVSQHLISVLPSTATYVGVDIHPESVTYANSHYRRSNATFVSSIPNDSFDAIVYADVLEHLDQPLEFLSDHHNRLVPGGTIVGSIPNGVGPFEIESWLDRRFKVSQRLATMMARIRSNGAPPIPYNSGSGHLQFYRKKEFFGILANAGFHIVEFKNGTFFGAMITERFLRVGGEPLMRANTAIAEALPFWAVLTWLFTARKA